MFKAIIKWFKNRRIATPAATKADSISYKQKFPEHVHLHWHISDIRNIPPELIWNVNSALMAKPTSTIKASDSTLFDEGLLEKARMQWQFGEWETLIKIDQQTLERHPERTKLALIVASAWQQSNDHVAARSYINLAKTWGCDKKLLASVLIAGVHNTLGRAAAINNEEEQALKHLRASVLGGDSSINSQIRIAREFSSIGKQTPTLLPISGVARRKDNSFRNIRKVLVSGDIFRPSIDGKLSQERNINWLYSLIGSQVLSSLSHENQIVEPEVKVFSGDLSLCYQVYDSMGLSFTEDDWPHVHKGVFLEPIKKILIKLFELEPEMLVIGFELSPALKFFFMEVGQVYIDIRISQFRYLDDLLLNFSSNDHEVNLALKKYKITDYALCSAAKIEKFKRGNVKVNIEPGSLVFFGQAPKDATLMDLGCFDTYRNYIKTLSSYKDNFSSFYYKPHPYLIDKDAISFFENIGYKLINDNVYDLLSSVNLEKVVALNSSVIFEAEFFKKKTIRFREYDIYKDTIPIYHSFLKSEFWTDILNLEKQSESFEIKFQPNYLRGSLGAFWGK